MDILYTKDRFEIIKLEENTEIRQGYLKPLCKMNLALRGLISLLKAQLHAAPDTPCVITCVVKTVTQTEICKTDSEISLPGCLECVHIKDCGSFNMGFRGVFSHVFQVYFSLFSQQQESRIKTKNRTY